MYFELSPKELEAQKNFRAFVDTEIVPFADENDRAERTPTELIARLGEKGYLGSTVPNDYGGGGMDMLTFGLLAEEIGRGSASLLSLLTVHGMVATCLNKWGMDDQKAKWLPKLASGELIGAFGLTEPAVGSDARNVQSTADRDNGDFVLNGRKKWISFGQVADLFLIIAQCENEPTAFIVERSRPGFSSVPINGMYGFKSAMLAELHMDDCRVPEANLIARVGSGFNMVAASALDFGRYCVGFGSVGLAQACLEATLAYSTERRQGEGYLRHYQLIQKIVAEMITNIRAARLLCRRAGYLKDNGDPDSIMETSIAKYFASTIANRVSGDALQIHGANGCSSEYPLQRYVRDAKIMEIIEGTTQIQHVIISKYGYQLFNRQQRMSNRQQRMRKQEEA